MDMAKPKWAIAYEDETNFDNLKPLMLRKRVRYQLSRLHTEALGGAKADPPKGFKKFFEAQDEFDGWKNWGGTWDVGMPLAGDDFANDDSDSEDPLEVVPRFITIEEKNRVRMDNQMRSNELETRRNRRAQKMGATNGSKDNG